MSDEALITDLQRAAAKLGDIHLSAKLYDKLGEYTNKTMGERFGSWNEAMVKAGLKVKKIARVSDRELLVNLKKVWDSLGRQPKRYEIKKPLSEYSVTPYVRLFGSWRGALEEFSKIIKNGELKFPDDYENISRNKRRPQKMNRKISKSMRFDVLKRDHFKCQYCGASPATDPKVVLHVDHIIPLSEGGTNTIDNLITSCNDCNSGKGTKSISN